MIRRRINGHECRKFQLILTGLGMNIKRFRDMKYPRYSSAATLWNDRIFICGGWTDGSLVKVVECFNPEDGSWIEFTNAPTLLGGLSLISYGNKLVLMGGTSGGAHLNTVWELELLQPNAQWKRLPAMKYGCIWLGAITLDSQIYAMGGSKKIGTDTDRVEIFDGERWRNAPALPDKWCNMSSMIIPQSFAETLSHYYNTK